jgi:hypothetical protein
MPAKRKVYIIDAGRSRIAVAMLVDALTLMTLGAVVGKDVLGSIGSP